MCLVVVIGRVEAGPGTNADFDVVRDLCVRTKIADNHLEYAQGCGQTVHPDYSRPIPA